MLRKSSLTFLCVTLFLSLSCATLGTWQLSRLRMKEAVLSEIKTHERQKETRLTFRRECAFSESLGWGSPIKTQGHFSSDSIIKVHATGGWSLVTLWQTTEGCLLLVDLGFLPDDTSFSPLVLSTLKGDKTTTEITGRLKQPARPHFTSFANNTLENRWYRWELPEMAHWLLEKNRPQREELKRNSLLKNLLEPFVLELSLPSQTLLFGAGKLSSPVHTALPPNNHFGYALTWYSLSLLICAMGGWRLVSEKSGQFS